MARVSHLIIIWYEYPCPQCLFQNFSVIAAGTLKQFRFEERRAWRTTSLEVVVAYGLA